MRKMTVAIVLATTALSMPAQARDKAWYVGLEGGGMLVEDYRFDLRSTGGAQTNNAIRGNHAVGFDVGGTIGYDFGLIRTEFEVGYRRAEVDSLALNTAVANFPGLGGATAPAGVFPDARGRSAALSFMANAMLDVGDDKGWSAFAGGGVGVARVELQKLVSAPARLIIADDSDTHFAWQIIAGVRRYLTERVDVGIKYRLFTTPDVRFRTTNGLALEDRFRSHSLLLTLNYNFGERAAPPPPATPAPPPLPEPPLPPPVAPMVQPGPFLIFFDWDKADITTDAAAILDRAIEQYRATGQTSVQLAGHTDKSGKPSYNQGLSMRRAMNTRAYMTSHGVPDGVIAAEGFGESRPLVETADGVREPQNRRVEITFAGGGMAAAPGTSTDTSMAPAPAPSGDPAMAPTSETTTTTTTTTTTDAPPPQQ